jgi:hypothetical protein
MPKCIITLAPANVHRTVFSLFGQPYAAASCRRVACRGRNDNGEHRGGARGQQSREEFNADDGEVDGELRVMATTVTSDDLGAARTSRIHAERRGGEARTGRIHAERRGGGEKKHAPATSMATTSPVTGRSTRAGTEEGRRG